MCTLPSSDAARGSLGFARQRELGFGSISPTDQVIRDAACQRLDSLTKPLGALGRLEPLAAQVCAVQRTLRPMIIQPVAVVFAGDHGIADRGVSAYPSAVTAQMVKNFLSGGAAISVLARLQGADLWVVDAGVNADCESHPRLIDAKIRRGTRDFTTQAAMTREECLDALSRARAVIDQVVPREANTLLLGEMGIGNTASAAVLMHGLTGHPLADCVGRGTGLDDAGLARKRTILAAALERRTLPSDPVDLLAEVGGYEIAMLVGSLLHAASRQILIIVDGFTATVAATLAARIEPRVLDYCVFGHCSAEHGHRALLSQINVQPLLDLGMRLGEGSGAAVALSVVQAAVRLFTEMATFEGAGVSEKTS